MKQKNQNMVTAGFIALGCPKNIVDSERMLAEIAQAGILITPDADNADVVVINTCGFIAPARDEAMDVINHALSMKKKRRVGKVIVAGCLPQRDRAQLLKEAPGIDAIVGLDQRDNIAQIILDTLNSERPAEHLDPTGPRIHDDRTRLRITPAHTAYLRISEGCDKKCSFCTIPSIRGPFRSKPPDVVRAEAGELVASDAVELNIIAQDTTNYARDLRLKDGLAHLLPKLADITGLQWIRLMYLYPTGFTETLIKTIASHDKILNYLDIPIQHINNKILRAMKRPDTKEQITSLIETLRQAIPDCVIRTTVIVGFPGETDRQFAELLDFIQWARFDHLGCFTFYPEQGTPAADLPGQLPENVKQQRREQLMLTQQKLAFEKNKARIGTTLRCLLDSIDRHRTGIARFYGQAPDIDSVCLIKNCKLPPGRFLNAKVTAAKDYDLLCKPAPNHA
jgi:ribosomal protein S12 methylthiotransferase